MNAVPMNGRTFRYHFVDDVDRHGVVFVHFNLGAGVLAID
jgi:hypothetical protein